MIITEHQAWEPKNRMDVARHTFQLFTRKVCILGNYDVPQKLNDGFMLLELGLFDSQSIFFDLLELLVISRKAHIFSRFSADKE